MRQKLLRWFLDTVICALFALMLFLMYQTWVVGSGMLDNSEFTWLKRLTAGGLTGSARALIDLPPDRSYTAAAQPSALVVTTGGARTGARFSSVEVSAVAQHFNVALGEALDSMAASESVTKEAFAALLSNSVCMIYPAPVKLSLLRDWHTNRIGGALAGQTEALAIARGQGGEITLCWRDGGTYYAARTEARYPETLPLYLAPCQLGLDLPDRQGMDDFYALFADPPALDAWSAEAAPERENWGLALLKPAGIHYDTATNYIGANNSRVYTENTLHMRVNADGTAEFNLVGGAGESQPADMPLTAMAEQARAMVMAGQPYWGRDTAVALTGVRENGQTVELVFSYVLSGLPIVGGDSGTAGVFSFERGVLTHAYLKLVKFTRGKPMAPLTPEWVALSILNASYPGSVLRVAYLEQNGALRAAWIPGDAP